MELNFSPCVYCFLNTYRVIEMATGCLKCNLHWLGGGDEVECQKYAVILCSHINSYTDYITCVIIITKPPSRHQEYVYLSMKKNAQRSTWSPPGLEGWYGGPASKHYQCYTCYRTISTQSQSPPSE